jgi:hypothetical protein
VRETFPARPSWCQDSTCTPDVKHDMIATHGEGSTGWCCGRTAETMVTVRQGVEHVNDGHFCIRSPRGVVMLEIQEADLEIMGRLAFRGMVARHPNRQFNGFWFTGRKEGFAAVPEADGGDQQKMEAV